MTRKQRREEEAREDRKMVVAVDEKSVSAIVAEVRPMTLTMTCLARYRRHLTELTGAETPGAGRLELNLNLNHPCQGSSSGWFSAGHLQLLSRSRGFRSLFFSCHCVSAVLLEVVLQQFGALSKGGEAAAQCLTGGILISQLDLAHTNTSCTVQHSVSPRHSMSLSPASLVMASLERDAQVST